MTIQYALTEKGKKNIDSIGGHLERMLKALAAKPLSSSELEKIVARHSDSDRPHTLSSWYLAQAFKMGWVSRKVVKEAK